MTKKQSAAIFLDRDGVIIENCDNYVRSWADVQIYSQAMEALVRIAKVEYKIVIVTNQSAVGRGLISLEQAKDINQQLIDKIADAGGRVDALYMCPHAPWENCECRKPAPGLFFQAERDLDLDLDQSIMIGDALTDLDAASAAGIKVAALVLTGRGSEQLRQAGSQETGSSLVFDDLTAAVGALVISSRERSRSNQ